MSYLLLDQEPRSPPDRRLADLFRVRLRLPLRAEVVPPHPYPLPPREAERLDHELDVRILEPLPEVVDPVERPVVDEPPNLVLPHQISRELLVRLEPRRLPIRADRWDPRRVQRVHDPRRERRLRPDHREVDPAGLRPRNDRGDVRGVVDQDVLRRLPNPGVLVPHRREDVRTAPSEGLDDRVLATSTADDEDVHACEISGFGYGIFENRRVGIVPTAAESELSRFELIP